MVFISLRDFWAIGMKIIGLIGLNCKKLFLQLLKTNFVSYGVRLKNKMTVCFYLENTNPSQLSSV